MLTYAILDAMLGNILGMQWAGRWGFLSIETKSVRSFKLHETRRRNNNRFLQKKKCQPYNISLAV